LLEDLLDLEQTLLRDDHPRRQPSLSKNTPFSWNRVSSLQIENRVRSIARDAVTRGRVSVSAFALGAGIEIAGHGDSGDALAVSRARTVPSVCEYVS